MPFIMWWNRPRAVHFITVCVFIVSSEFCSCTKFRQSPFSNSGCANSHGRTGGRMVSFSYYKMCDTWRTVKMLACKILYDYHTFLSYSVGWYFFRPPPPSSLFNRCFCVFVISETFGTHALTIQCNEIRFSN